MQTVVNQWSDGLLFDELLAQHGFAVLHADNRGMAGRGREFAQAAYHNFGPVQFEDQLTVVDAVLAKYPQLDAEAAGLVGLELGRHVYAVCADAFRSIPRGRGRGAGDRLAQLRFDLYGALHEPADGFSGGLQGFLGREFGCRI